MSPGETVEGRLTTSRTIVLATSFIILGGVLIWISVTPWVSSHPVATALCSQFGALILATALITIGWDLVGRRAFVQEILAKARLSTDVVASGLTQVTDQYLPDVPWPALLRDVQSLDILVAYASTWRNTHRGQLQQAAARPNTRIRVFLPDYRNDLTMSALTDRFGYTREDLTARIQEAVNDFRSLRRPGGADLQVYLRAGDPMFSCYRFDSHAVLTLYSHTRGRRARVPTFVMTGGTLYAFVYEELEAIASQAELAPG